MLNSFSLDAVSVTTEPTPTVTSSQPKSSQISQATKTTSSVTVTTVTTGKPSMFIIYLFIFISLYQCLYFFMPFIQQTIAYVYGRN